MRSYDDTGVIFPTMKPLDMPKKADKAEAAPAEVKKEEVIDFSKVERCKGVERILLCAAADGYVGRQQGEAECQHQHEVDEQKQSTAVLGAEIGEAPDIADAHCAARRSQHKAERTAETTAFFMFDSLFSFM